MRRLVLGLCLFVALLSAAVPAHAAIARVDFSTCNSGTTAGTTTMDCTGLDVSGANKAIYCWAGSNDTTDLTLVVTYDLAGAMQVLTEVGEHTGGTGRYLWVGRYVGPTDGSNKTVTFAGLSAVAQDSGGCGSFTGIDPADPDDTVSQSNLANITNPWSSATITSPAGDWILSFVAEANSTDPGVSGGGQTLIAHSAAASATFETGAAEDIDGADDTIDWTGGTGNAGTMLSFNVNAAAVAGGGSEFGDLGWKLIQ